MCGIFGWLSWGTPVPLAACERALAQMATRGPDGQGLWQGAEGRLVLGHRRLATRDLRGGQQPLHAPEHGLSAVVNGELYHTAAQRAELTRWGYRFRSHSDSELVLALYARYGKAFVSHLHGEFALLLWDGDRLLAVRDRFGIKPLCYHLGPEGLQLASKARALLALEEPSLTARWCQNAWQQALSMQYLLPGDHLLEGVQTLPPGHLLEVKRDGRMHLERWWELDYPQQNAPPEPSLSPGDWSERLATGLHTAVAERCQADVPICAHLSGGIDSSAVLAEFSVQNLAEQPVTAFNVCFSESPDYDENAQAAATARFCGAQLETVRVTLDDLIAALPASVALGEGLVINGHVAAKYRLNQAIRAQGFRVALTGEGADELLLGYSHLLQDLGQPQQQPLLQGMHLAAGPQLDLGAVQNCLGGHLPAFLQAKASLGARLHSLLDTEPGPGAAERLAAWLPLDALAGRHPVHQSAWIWSCLALSGYILHTVGDGTEMAHGVEGRLPFLDHRLFDSLRNCPPQAHLAGSLEKRLLRQALAGRLPPEVLQRHKRPFLSPPLLAYPRWQRWLRECLLDGPPLPWVGRQALEALLQRLPTLSPAEQLLWDPPLHLLLSAQLLQDSWKNLKPAASAPVCALQTPAFSTAQRQALYTGQIWQLPASAASLAVVSQAWSQLCAHLGPAPQQAHLHMDAEALRSHLAACRSALQQDGTLRQAYAELLRQLGCDPADCRVDAPRLRAIVPGLENVPEAAPVFYAHRDTWYANPAAQINLWLPLHACVAAQTFVFWPEAFERAVLNDSAAFDYARWQRETGFQATAHSSQSIYPRSMEPPPGPAQGFACQTGQPLFFAAAHLHGSLPNPGPGIRFSLDLRLVHLPDQLAGKRAPDPDNASQGSTLPDYRWLVPHV